MDEIAALQARLQEVQLQSTAHRFSERNCVELILKLVEKGEIDVIFGVSGKDYITHRQLAIEIADELTAHQGRIALTELQAIIGVPMNQIQAKVNALLASDSSVRMLNDELISDYYMDNVVAEVDQALVDSGSLVVSAFAESKALPTSFMREAVERRLGTSVHGELRGDVLFTAAFVQRHAARIRGALSGATRPLSFTAVVRRLGLLDSLAFDQATQLIASGQLLGKLTGSNSQATYTPALHVQQQEAQIQVFFQQNGCVQYEMVQKQQAGDAKAYLKKTFPDGRALASCWLSNESAEALRLHVDDALAASSWLHAAPLLPSVLTRQDVEELLNQLVGKSSAAAPQNEARVMASEFVVSPAFYSGCSERAAEALVPQLLDAYLALPAAEAQSQSQSQSQQDSKAKVSSSKAKGGKARQDSDDDDERDASPRVSKKPAKKGASASASASSKETASKGPMSFDRFAADWLREARVKAFLRSASGLRPDEEQLPDELSAALAQAITPSLLAQAAAKYTEVAKAREAERARLAAEAEAAAGSASASGEQAEPSSAAPSAAAEDAGPVPPPSRAVLRKLLASASGAAQDLYEHVQMFHSALAHLHATVAGGSAPADSGARWKQGTALGAEAAASSGAGKGKGDGKQGKGNAKSTSGPAAGGKKTKAKDDGDSEPLPEVVALLHKHLLKTMCTELTNLLIVSEVYQQNSANSRLLNGLFAAPPSGAADFEARAQHSFTQLKLSSQQRGELLATLSAASAAPLRDLAASLSAQTCSDFLSQVEAAAAAGSQVQLKPLDKKRERSMGFNMRRALKLQLESESDPNRVLLLAALIAHSAANPTGAVLHAPARAITALLVDGAPALPAATQAALHALALALQQAPSADPIARAESPDASQAADEVASGEAGAPASEPAHAAAVSQNVQAVKALFADSAASPPAQS